MKKGILAALIACLALAAPAVASSSIKGSWRGTYRVVKGGSGSATVKVKITRLRKGRTAGTVSYPGSACHGTVVLLRHTRSGYVFRYRERGRGGCTGDDQIVMRRQGSRLYWRATAPGGGQVGVGRLRHSR
jgi:hypothetical protein